MDPEVSVWSKILSGIESFGVVAALGGLIAAILLVSARRSGRRWLPLQRLRWGRWSGTEVLYAAMIFFLTPALVMTLLIRTGFIEWYYDGQKASDIRQSLWTGPLSLVLFLGLVFGGLYLMSRTYPQDVGVSPSRWKINVVLGCFGFLLATPVILSVFALLSLLPGTKEHPFAELTKAKTIVVDAQDKVIPGAKVVKIDGKETAVGGDGKPIPNAKLIKKREKLDLAEWCLFLFAACIYAPISEELIFRGVIQGWLRRATLTGHVSLLVIFCGLSFNACFDFGESAKKAKDIGELFASADEIKINWARLVVTGILAWYYVFKLRQFDRAQMFLMEADFRPEGSASEAQDSSETPTRSELELAAARWLAQDREQQWRKSGVAIYGSAMAWALMHSSWPDPVALLMLGLVLGWLTQRTQSLVSALTLHALFNLVACLTLLLAAD